MYSKDQNSTDSYSEPVTRKKLKPLYVSLEDMIPDYSELLEQHESDKTEKSQAIC